MTIVVLELKDILRIEVNADMDLKSLLPILNIEMAKMKLEFIDSREKCRAIDQCAIGEPSDGSPSLPDHKNVHTETDVKNHDKSGIVSLYS